MASVALWFVLTFAVMFWAAQAWPQQSMCSCDTNNLINLNKTENQKKLQILLRRNVTCFKQNTPCEPATLLTPSRRKKEIRCYIPQQVQSYIQQRGISCGPLNG